MAEPMHYLRRLEIYRAQRPSAEGNLTPRQFKRWRKKQFKPTTTEKGTT